MKTVLLVGAGATLAEALPTQPSRSNTPPLDRTFFDLCRLARLDRFSTVSQYMRATYGIDLTSDRPSMEEVFNYLYADAIGPASSDASVEAYWALIRMYAAAITRTTGSLHGRSQVGVGGLMRHLWHQGERDIEIVTFNQDLVIENALEEMIATDTYSSMRWDFQNCYETEFETWWTNRNQPMFELRDADSIRVLKLHGSLNWVYRARSAEDARNALRQPMGQLACLTRRRLPTELRGRSGGRRVHLLPLIVPPIYEKSQHVSSTLDSVWSAAEQAFSGAERLIAFGYSFPAADFSAVSLVRRAFIRNNSLNEISVINPDPHVAGKVGALTQAPVLHAYEDLKAFKSSTA